MTREARTPFNPSYTLGLVFGVPVVSDSIHLTGHDLNEHKRFLKQAQDIVDWYDELHARHEERMIAISPDPTILHARVSMFNPRMDGWMRYDDMDFELRGKRYWVDLT